MKPETKIYFALRISLAVCVLSCALSVYSVPARNHQSAQPAPNAQAIGLQLRTIANQIEDSSLPNKSDLAERVEELSAEVLAAQ